MLRQLGFRLQDARHSSRLGSFPAEPRNISPCFTSHCLCKRLATHTSADDVVDVSVVVWNESLVVLDFFGVCLLGVAVMMMFFSVVVGVGGMVVGAGGAGSDLLVRRSETASKAWLNRVQSVAK